MGLEDFPSHLEHGSGVMMDLEPNRLLISFRKSHTTSEVSELLHEYNLVLESLDDFPTNTSPKTGLINNTKKRFWVCSIKGQPITFSLPYSKLDIDWVGPVYRLGTTGGPGGRVCPLPNILLIGVSSPNKKIKKLPSNIIEEYGLKEVPLKSRYLRGYRYFVISDPEKNNAYQVRADLTRKNRTLDIKFENMPMLVPLTFTPTDSYYPLQWNMNQIHAGVASGTEITGWDITQGSGSIIISIIDNGCELAHRELKFASAGINLYDPLQNGGPTGNFHGTACAGIAAATINFLGVAGVAGNCMILPLAFENFTDVELATGIMYAIAEGSKVISISAGNYGPDEVIGGPVGWDFSIIDPAIVCAYNNGCVICAATGNDDNSTYNLYPARHPNVIACGASDVSDNRKKSSVDSDWGSNYGPGVSVVAPGVCIPTTSTFGGVPENDTQPTPNGDSYMFFGGTSAATPHVAGLAALLFSLNHTNTNVQIRNIIEATAEKVGTIPYSDVPGYPNGTRNQEMGYGRIDVFTALKYGKYKTFVGLHDYKMVNKLVGSLADGPSYIIKKNHLIPVPPRNPTVMRQTKEARNQIVDGLVKLHILGQQMEKTNSPKSGKKRKQTKLIKRKTRKIL